MLRAIGTAKPKSSRETYDATQRADSTLEERAGHKAINQEFGRKRSRARVGQEE